MIQIVIMGGCLGTGNTGPVVEFNIQVSLCRLPRNTLALMHDKGICTKFLINVVKQGTSYCFLRLTFSNAADRPRGSKGGV